MTRMKKLVALTTALALALTVSGVLALAASTDPTAQTTTVTYNASAYVGPTEAEWVISIPRSVTLVDTETITETKIALYNAEDYSEYDGTEKVDVTVKSANGFQVLDVTVDELDDAEADELLTYIMLTDDEDTESQIYAAADAVDAATVVEGLTGVSSAGDGANEQALYFTLLEEPSELLEADASYADVLTFTATEQST